jgi:hypothetical protein
MADCGNAVQFASQFEGRASLLRADIHGSAKERPLCPLPKAASTLPGVKSTPRNSTKGGSASFSRRSRLRELSPRPNQKRNMHILFCSVLSLPFSRADRSEARKDPNDLRLAGSCSSSPQQRLQKQDRNGSVRTPGHTHHVSNKYPARCQPIFYRSGKSSANSKAVFERFASGLCTVGSSLQRNAEAGTHVKGSSYERITEEG